MDKSFDLVLAQLIPYDCALDLTLFRVLNGTTLLGDPSEPNWITFIISCYSEPQHSWTEGYTMIKVMKLILL